MIRLLIPIASFTVVALASFSIWAFSRGFFSSATGLYSACAIVFFCLGGLSLVPFSGGKGLKPRWELIWIFPLAFLFYAISWCVGWSTFPSHFGEIMGSAIGILGMTAIFKWLLKFPRSILEAAGTVFLFYTLGYYLGEKIHLEFRGLWGKLGWGACYGAFLATGLVHLIQLSANSRN